MRLETVGNRVLVDVMVVIKIWVWHKLVLFIIQNFFLYRMNAVFELKYSQSFLAWIGDQIKLFANLVSKARQKSFLIERISFY